MTIRKGFAFCVLLLCSFAIQPISHAVVPQASDPGPFAVTSAEYKFPAGFDPIVLGVADSFPFPFRLQTELWARVYRPNPTPSNSPLLVFLHGNHATCGRFAGAGQGRLDINVQYTIDGTCPPGYVPVPSHEGYAYLAERLASHGYIVVSINANRGVNAAPGFRTTPAGTPLAPTDDPGLNQRRGRLVLRHLEKLVRWNSGSEATPPSLGTNLTGKIDFSNVGFMGHSRGGEGVRAAYNFYVDPATPGAVQNWTTTIPGMVIKGVFEIGPVDGQTGFVFNALGTAWNVLLPMCDGDVSNLQGVRPFDRMLLATMEATPTQKSTFTVWGTNHNFYNTEWQTSDSAGCLGHMRLFKNLIGSPDQRSAGLAAVMAFFRGTVGTTPNPAFLQIFNPQFDLPAEVTTLTRVDRGYTDSPDSSVTRVFDNFQPASTNVRTGSGITLAIGGIANHSGQQQVAQITWNGAGPSTFFQTAAAANVNAGSLKTLDFRVSRQCGDPACTKPDSFFNFETSFSIRLVDGNGNVSSPELLKDYVSLTGPVGGLVRLVGSSPHPILQTVRIPLSAFTGVDLTKLRAVRFVFDDTRRDEIFIGNVNLSMIGASLTSVSPLNTLLPTSDSVAETDDTTNDNNKVKSIKKASATNGESRIEIELTSNREFTAQGELLVLNVSGREFITSRYGASNDTKSIIFSMTSAEFATLSQGDPIRVYYGTGTNGGRNFGHIDKGMLGR